MADLDKDLELKIAANATQATEAIDGLIDKLIKLNQSLSLGNLERFSSQLKDIASAANSLSGISKDINAISSAGSKLASLTGFKTLNDQMQEVEAESRRLAKAVSDYFSFDKAKNGKRNIEELGNYIASTMRNAAKTGNTNVIREQAELMGDIIAESSVTVQDIQAEAAAYADLADWVKKTTLYLDDKTKANLKHADSLNAIKAAFKGITSDPTKGTSLDTFLMEVEKFGVGGGHPEEAITAIARAVNEYNYAVKNAVVQGRAQIGAGLASEKDFQEAGRSLASNVEKSFGKIFSEEGTKKDLFGSLLPSLTELSGITIPDFSGLNVLADALTKLQHVNAKQIQSIVSALHGLNVNINTSGLEGAVQSAQNIGDTSPKIKETADAMNHMAEGLSAVGKNASSAINVGELEKGTKELEKTAEEFNNVKDAIAKGTGSGDGSSALAQEMQRISEKIKEVKSQMYELNDINGSDGSDKYKELEDSLQSLIERYEALNNIGKKNESVVSGQKTGNIDLLASLVALGHELQTVASTFDKWGDAGIRLVKMVFSPLRHEFEEFKSKISGISNAMKNLRNTMQKHLDKMSAFWKRTMKTFTFMLVRKAITAILNETKNAIDSLAAWSNTFGTQFNSSMSEIVADATYLARSLIAIFEPIINAIVPILNTLVEALGRAARALAEFFAAFTGQNYFMVAKKQVGNYTDSLNKANKAQKNLTMGIDELNILSENNSGGGSGGGLGGLGDWDTAPVSDKMRKFADDIKEILDKLFDPIKKAWDKAKTYVTNSFKYMTDELGKLAKKMGQDFLDVWNQPKTVQMLTELFMILGDIETTIGNLAKRFREAWTEGDKGKKIFEGIRDILAILIGHVRNVTFYMTKWSNSLNFNPLLEKTVELLQKMKPLAEFIGGLFQDIMKNVVLQYIKFLIEDGIPHLLKTIGEILDAFDFSKLREQFVPLEKAFEKVLENIDKGVVNAIGNFGKAVGEFTQSDEFQKFLDTIVWFMDQITEARVQKVFDVLGGAILKVAKALINFVSSDDFKDFLEMLLKWFDDTDTDKLSNGLINIAKAILAFKFTGFIGKGVAGFASFLSVLASAKNAIGILTGLGSAGTAAGAGGTAAAGGFGAFAAAIAPVAAVIAGIVTAVYSLVKSFGGVKGVVEEVSRHFKLVTDVLKRVAEALKLNDFIDRLKKSFDDLKESLGAQKGLWQAIMYVLDAVAIVVGTVLIPVFEVICHVLSSLIEICAGVIEGIGGVFNVLMGFINGDGQQISEGWSQIFGGMEKAVDGFLDFFLGDDTPLRKLVDFIANEIFGKIKEEAEKKWKEIKEKILIPIKEAYDKASERFSKLKEDAGKKWDEIKKNAEATWLLIKNNIIDPVKEAYNNTVEKFNKLKEDAGKKWDETKKKAEDTWLLIKQNIINPIVEAYNKVMEKVRLLKEEIGKKWDEIKKKAEDTWLLIKNNIIDPVVEAYNKTVEKFRQLRDDAGKAWDEFVKKIKESTVVQFFSDLVDKVKEVIDWFKKFNGDAKDSWNEFCSAIENSAIVTFISGLVDKVVELINKFKDLKGAADDAKGSADEVKAPQAESHFNGGFVGTYATGGYPSRGTLFWAGEYGLPEMLGTVGGKTAVASSAEITGIRESVMESSIAEQNMMGQMINLLQTIALKDTSVNLDSRELVSSLNDRARRNGYNFRAATT